MTEQEGQEGLRQRPGDQVLPTPNDGPSMHMLVIGDIAAREALGVSRYGTPLQAFNGRDALRDILEELLDASVYVKQAMVERDSWRDPAKLAQLFHETYERLAPLFGYETREESAKPWAEVPERNRKLMTAVCEHVLSELCLPLALAPAPPERPDPPEMTHD
jgi:hypothetical protein